MKAKIVLECFQKGMKREKQTDRQRQREKET